MIGNRQVWVDTQYGGKYVSQEEYEEFRDTLNCKEEIQQILKKYPKNILKGVLLNILKELT